MPIEHTERRRLQPHVIYGKLSGSDRCSAGHLRVRAAAPVIALCRALIAAGEPPGRTLHLYRGGMLALTVRSIAEGARLRIASHGVGFERLPERTRAPRMARNEPAAPKIACGRARATGGPAVHR